ncbi:MAG: hypothetical protein ABIP79_05415 [Chitinophagaceae bacterium]
MKKLFTNSAFFLYLLPVFFVMHGYTENYNLVPVKDAVWLTIFYIGCTIVVSLLCWLVYKNFRKADLTAFVLMVIFFFFGTVHDALKNILPNSFITKYSFILPLLLILALLLIFLVKKSKSDFRQLFLYLNSVLLILLVVEALSIVKKTATTKNSVVSLNKEFTDCKNCPKPDIYMIITDGYTSNTALEEVFNFDNSAFEAELRQRNFHVNKKSFSNYNATAYSMNSILNLNYLSNLISLNDSKENLGICYENIKQNQTLLFLKEIGYQFYNYSDFSFPGQPAVTNPTFLLAKTRTITSQTLSGRISRDLWYHLATDLKLKSVINNYVYRQLNNNNKVFKLTEDVVVKESVLPKFVYSHLIIPHNPYYFDKDGNPAPIEKLTDYSGANRKDYIEYLQYANKKLLSLIDHIKNKSSQPPIIILMGDHGFRQFNDSTEKKYQFMNLSSIFLPNANYSGFYDSSSLVNQMRIFLNTQFNQKLPLLKDSTVFIQQ